MLCNDLLRHNPRTVRCVACQAARFSPGPSLTPAPLLGLLANMGVPALTTDGELATEPARPKDEPKVAEAMARANFQAGTATWELGLDAQRRFGPYDHPHRLARPDHAGTIVWISR